MNTKIKQYWQQYSNAGVTPSLSMEEIKLLRLKNLVTIETSILTIVYIALYLIADLLLPALIMVFALLIYAYVIKLNHRQLYSFATVLLLVNGNFQISMTAVLLGRDAGVHLFLFAAAVSPFLYYSIRQIRTPMLFSLMTAILYVSLELNFYYSKPWIPLSEAVSKASYIITYLSCMFAVVSFAIYLYSENLQNQDQLEKERQRSEHLLQNILPKQIAERLKNGETPIADQYDNVSILFTDLVGFTPLSAKLSARDSFALLSEIFGYLDSVVDHVGVEKVRTIGDGYYVVSGVPQNRPDHAQALARAALEMLKFKDHMHSPLAKDIAIRIGINSGPVIAGVIGQKKFQFDMWGDTVNTASRMESHGVPGKIQISNSTYELIKNEFDCEPRGEINIKGKKIMNTWFLDAVK